MDFAEARNYQAGDEVRHMEWRVTARSGRPHVKVYQEERERPVLLWVDFSPSMFFGTRVAFKSVVAARLAAILAWTVVRQGDRVGGLVFTEDTHQAFVPRAKQHGVLPLLASLSHCSEGLNAHRADQSTGFNQALLRAQRLVRPGCVVLLISDFYAMDAHSERLLMRLHAHNDLLAYHVCDPLELAPPPPQVYGISDGQTDAVLDTTLADVRAHYQQYCDQRLLTLQASMKRLGIPYVQVTTQTSLASLVKQTFPGRAK